MHYFSTNKKAHSVNFREAALAGMAPDKGLYFPEEIPKLSADFISNLKSKSKAELAYEIIKPYVSNSIPEGVLAKICSETVNFDFPLVQVNEDIYSLELFHGPTLAFKDVGARFMSRCLSYFSKESKKKTTVLVATSGDTGSAVANSFLGVEGVEVVILYPSGKVSNIQELQLTTLGNNIKAIEIQGDFDDCQRLVKEAFSDNELNQKMNLVSANSINIARWLSQQFYYFFALQQWSHPKPPVICVPSGNFGNICAGLIAHLSGLPVAHFIAACNSNDAFPDYIKSGYYNTKDSISTISNAMDVGNPSNFVRILELFNHQHEKIKQKISSFSVNDELTEKTISEVHRKYNYLLDPHGAVAYYSLRSYLDEHPHEKGIILETAHPVKFNTVVEPIIKKHIEVPLSVQSLLEKQKITVKINPMFGLLKKELK
ncbi:MAG: threonine synthase [Flavobacteriia bacterium]|nr:threonine synthase [Flavobacteriia bacterium]